MRASLFAEMWCLRAVLLSCDFVVILPLCDFVVISISCDFIVISPSCDFVVISPSCDFIVVSPSCDIIGCLNTLAVFCVRWFLHDAWFLVSYVRLSLATRPKERDHHLQSFG
jgi:hypothetical protein